MTSIQVLAKSLKNKKIGATKLRREAEKKLQSTLSLKRRSSSGLASLERRKESALQKKQEILQLLNQYMAQHDSTQRLKIAAEERLRQEQEQRDQLQQQSEYAEPAEKTPALERLKMIDEKIVELESEMKQRHVAESRIVKLIADLEKQKSKVELEIKKYARSKPVLLGQLHSSTKAETSLRPRIQSLIKREEQANRNLSSVAKKLELLMAKQRAAKRKAAREKAKRRAAIRKAKRATKRKTRTKKATKRTVKRKAKTRTKRRAKGKAKVKRKVKRQSTKSRKSKRR